MMTPHSKQLLEELECLSCLSHGTERTDATICDILWKAEEGEPWALHAQTKQVIEFVFVRAVKGS